MLLKTIPLTLLILSISCTHRPKDPARVPQNEPPVSAHEPVPEDTLDEGEIRFGVGYEYIVFQTNGKEYELYSTFIGGRRLYLDGMRETDLNDSQKVKAVIDIIDFIQNKESEKTIVCFNEDYADAGLWRDLVTKYTSKIEAVEITNVQSENDKLYETMLEDVESGSIVHHFDSFKIETKEDLDKYWHLIKFKKENSEGNQNN